MLGTHHVGGGPTLHAQPSAPERPRRAKGPALESPVAEKEETKRRRPPSESRQKLPQCFAASEQSGAGAPALGGQASGTRQGCFSLSEGAGSPSHAASAGMGIWRKRTGREGPGRGRSSASGLGRAGAHADALRAGWRHPRRQRSPLRSGGSSIRGLLPLARRALPTFCSAEFFSVGVPARTLCKVQQRPDPCTRHVLGPSPQVSISRSVPRHSKCPLRRGNHPWWKPSF